MKKQFTFTGVVYSRSSKKSGGVPSERDILELNPERLKMLTSTCKWKDVYAGTLNIKIPEAELLKLSVVKPKLQESGVIYPEEYKHLPLKREPYLYYRAKIYNKDKKKVKCIVRRATNPVKNCLEVFYKSSIRKKLDLKDGDEVRIDVWGQEKDKETVQPISHSYLRNIYNEPVRMENLYNGGHAFLICSGTSFLKLDKDLLKFCFTMTVNNATKACMPHFRPNAWTCVDGADKFLYTAWQDPNIMKLVPESHRNKWLWNSDLKKPVGKQVVDCPNVMFWQRNNVFNIDNFLTEPSINWGNGSKGKDENGVKGKRSVMHSALKLLWILGFRHVYLLGCDFNMKEGEQNYSFAQGRTKGSVKGNNSSYKQMNWRFEKLNPKFKEAGFNVYNCNPDSGLTAFEHVTYDEAMKRALGYVHDNNLYVRNKLESTDGLYETKWFVCPKCKTDQRMSKTQVKDGYECKCGRKVTLKDRKKYVKDKDQKGIDS